MEIKEAAIVQDLRVFQARGVSKEFGKKVLKRLSDEGEIAPHRTRSGRNLLTFGDAERLAHEL